MSKTENSNFQMNRRNFLKAAVGTGVLAGTGFAIPSFVRAEEKESLVEDAEKVVHTFCSVCSANCAMIGYVKDDRLVHLAGNPYDLAGGDPFNPEEAGGRLCVKGYGVIQTLYDPDRLKKPLKRTNPNKGRDEDPGFVEIEWDEAIALAAEGLNKVIDQYGPESFMVLNRSHPYSVRLGRAIGTPNFVCHQSTCFTTQEAVWNAMVTGGGRPWTYDMENCNYILSFGWDGLGKGKNMQVRNTTRALQNGAKLVVLDPYRSITASKAHEWFPIKPGTDLAFCLAMINVIVKEGLYDAEFVNNYTYGFEEVEKFAEEYTPGWASEITGIPAEDIERIAKEFAQTKPAHIPSHKRDAAGPNYANSTRLAQAQLILNALVGTIDRRGGTILSRNPSMPGFDAVFPPPEYPEARKERIDAFERNNPFLTLHARGNFATLPYGILNEDPYPLKAALVRRYNTLSFPDAKKMNEAFASLDFMVCCEIYPSEMAYMSDIVFPEPHWLEISGFGARGYHSLYPQVAARFPVIKLPYDTRGFGGIIMALADAMGYGEYFEGVDGSVINEKQLEALGTSWEELEANNGIWEGEREFVPTEEFNTPSGKIELYATRFEEEGFDPLPYWQPRREEPDEEYPYNYIISRPAMHKMTQTQNNWLKMEIYPENHATMNVELGRELGIADGDEVYVESRAGKIKLKAKLIEGIRKDTIKVDHGFGHWSRSQTVAYQQGANDGDLIPHMTFDEQLGLKDPGFSACMCDFGVKVYKA